MIKIEFVNEYNKKTKLNVDTDNLEFHHGFAIVERKLSKTELIQVNLLRSTANSIIGVIDKNNDIVIPFKDYYHHIDIFSKNNFIISTKQHDSLHFEKIKMTHFHYSGKDLVPINELPGKYYKIIDDDKVIINNIEAGNKYMQIYDLNVGKFISNKFDDIDNFMQVDDTEVAHAVKNITVNDLSTSLHCYIDKNGKIVSFMYNSITDEYIDPTRNNFDFDSYVIKTKAYLTRKKEEENEKVKSLLKQVKRT